MIFADLPAAEAEGAILAHSQQVGARTFKKGTRLTADARLGRLRDAGVETVVAARLEPGDLDEDLGARRVAEACAGAGVSLSTAATGRVNLFAEADGVAVFDRARLDAVNLVAEEITLAAVHPFDRVERGQLIATVKVIPLGVAEATANAAAEAARAAARRCCAWRRSSRAPAGCCRPPCLGTRDKVLAKTTEAVRARVEGCTASSRPKPAPTTMPTVVARAATCAAARVNLILILGASATTDRRDVIPAGIEAAGGGCGTTACRSTRASSWCWLSWTGVPVLALPGSARSSRVGGNDWVLWRLMAGLEVTRTDIMRMGAGGLLKEIPTRPLPRAAAAPERARRRARRRGSRHSCSRPESPAGWAGATSCWRRSTGSRCCCTRSTPPLTPAPVRWWSSPATRRRKSPGCSTAARCSWCTTRPTKAAWRVRYAPACRRCPMTSTAWSCCWATCRR